MALANTPESSSLARTQLCMNVDVNRSEHRVMIGALSVVMIWSRSGFAAPAAVAAYIAAAYWFTASTSFANPAVTIARMFSNTFAGIAPGSVPGFIVAQVIGGVVGVGLVLVLYPHAGRTAGDVVVPHATDR